MNIRISRYLIAAVAVAILSFAPSALADGASMDLTGAGSNVLGGVYVGAYTVTINGVSTQVVCDDYADESYIGETWTATENALGTLTGTKWGSQTNATQGYDEMAWLFNQMFSTTNTQTIADIQYAIWAVFDPGALSAISGTDLANAEWWLTQAGLQSFYAGEFSNIVIYTPNTSYPISCSGQSCANTPPQEFMAYVATPEPSTVLMLGLGMLSLGFLFRRRAIA